jgi:transcriptional regulator with XRE-family HTH domain
MGMVINMNLKEFGIYFAKIRINSGFRSQRELSEKSGVSHSTINRIEAGTHKPTIDTIRKLHPHLKNVVYTELLEKLDYITKETPGNFFLVKYFEAKDDPSLNDPFFNQLRSLDIGEITELVYYSRTFSEKEDPRLVLSSFILNKNENNEEEQIFFKEYEKLSTEDRKKALDHIKFLRHLAEQENNK